MVQVPHQKQFQAQQQIQTLSPQQILVVKLLELPAIELEDRIRAELLENPALEEAGSDNPAEDNSDNSLESNEEPSAEYDSLDDYLTEDDVPDYKLQENNRSKEEQAADIPFSDTVSFYELLQSQLAELNLTEYQRELAEYLTGSLDDDGLLRKSLEDINDELAIYAGINASVQELEETLKIIQEFDPPGIGARDLRECLLIQIGHRRKEGKSDALADMQAAIIRDCYDEFTHK
ncbi:RNA polymerase sigma-54 factor, partial [termite gut metagenome]